MSKIATLEIDGNKFELPFIVGSENEGAVDISKLRTLFRSFISCDFW